MKKIGIFGDSFADPTWATNDYLGWPELLAKDYQVTNFSKCGSSLWWSYEKLKRLHAEFDYCIIVVTIYGRLYLEALDKHLNVNQNSWPVKHGINLGEVYYSEFFSESRDIAFHNFMMNDINSMKNVIYVPAFAECVLDTSWSLNHFATLELNHFGIVEHHGEENRKCHLTDGNNAMLYKKLAAVIESPNNSLVLSELDFVTPLKSINYYLNRL